VTDDDARTHFLADHVLRQQLILDLALEILEVLSGLVTSFSKVSMSGSLALTRIASSLLITSPSTLMFVVFRALHKQGLVDQVAQEVLLSCGASACAPGPDCILAFILDFEVRLCRACSKSSRVMTSLFTRATISSTITDFRLRGQGSGGKK